jgi:hypothetical protein
MNKRLATLAASVLVVPALGGVAFAAAHSVPDSPAPQVVIPASDDTATSGAETETETEHAPEVERADDRGTGDAATHDAGDDRDATGTDDPAGHDAGDDIGDDHGGLTPGSDDSATHDAGDDSGTTSTASGSTVTSTSDDGGHRGSDDNVTTSTTSTSGSEDGGSRHGGSDDGSGHH